MLRIPRILPLVGIVMASACERAPAAPVAPDGIAGMTIVSGDNQSALPGRELPQPLVVKVTDAGGQPVQGQAVVFRVSSGSGRVFAGIAVTNAQGLARERWTLGITAADSQRVQALGIDIATGEARIFATFKAQVITGQPATLTKLSGDNQMVEANARTDSMLMVVVRDSVGNPVKNVNVTFTSDRPGTFTYYNPSTTGLKGLAGIYFDPQYGGVTYVYANAPGLPQVRFTVTSRYGVASVQQTPAEMPLTVGQTGQITATAYNSSGQPIPDAPMKFLSNNPDVASVNLNTGVVTAKAVGRTFVLGVSERNFHDTTWVTVTAPTAGVSPAAGSPLAVRQTRDAAHPAFQAWPARPSARR